MAFIDTSGQPCSCDPNSPTTDCCDGCCTPFFSFFFVADALVLGALVAFVIIVECLSVKKSNLWRIIFGTGIIACCAKVARLGVLAISTDPTYMPVFVLNNTHLCFGFISFLSLVFFWARLHHDFAVNKGLFGKLLPTYIFVVVLTIIVCYIQIPLEEAYPSISDAFKVLDGIIAFVVALAYIVYGFLLWKRFLVDQKDHNTFLFKIFVSAFVTAVSLVVESIILFTTRFETSNTTRDYLIRHSFYETIYLSQFLSLPGGFVVHFFQNFQSMTTEHPNDAPSYRSSTISSNRNSTMSPSPITHKSAPLPRRPYISPPSRKSAPNPHNNSYNSLKSSSGHVSINLQHVDVPARERVNSFP